MVFRAVVITGIEAAILTTFAASICWIARNVVKDPSSKTMNFVKFTAVFAGRVTLKKILPR